MRKHSNGVKSGDLGNHEVRPLQPIKRPGKEDAIPDHEGLVGRREVHLALVNYLINV